MLTLAVGGIPIIAAAVGLALLLVFLLFRAEDRFDAEDREAERRAHAATPPSGAPGGQRDRPGSS